MLLLGLLAWGAVEAADLGVSQAAAAAASASNTKESRMWITVGQQRFAVTLADTEAARAFAARLPLTLAMTELNGNEKKFDLPTPLPSKPIRPGTIRHGDLMLYGANTVVLFYQTFDSAYAYSRLGRVDDPAKLEAALGPGDARVAFSRD